MADVIELDGRRMYREGGLVVPSVSQVLRTTGPRKWGLERWQRNMGAAAERIAAIARGRGQQLHREILAYRATGQAPAEPSVWWTSVESTVRALAVISDVVLAEQPLVHPIDRFGGTPDDVCRMRRGPLVIHDWKTSTERRGPELLADYADQLAGYVDLVALELGERPQLAVVVIAIPEEPAQVVPIDLRRAVASWRERLAQYHDQAA